MGVRRIGVPLVFFSPQGMRFEVQNLRAWAREYEDVLDTYVDKVTPKLRTYLKFYCSMCNNGQWFGWMTEQRKAEKEASGRKVQKNRGACWVITSPSGEQVVVKNLSLWARENVERLRSSLRSKRWRERSDASIVKAFMGNISGVREWYDWKADKSGGMCDGKA